MDTNLFLGQLGAVLSLFVAAVGSCLGVSAAGTSAAGAWAKDARAGKPLRFIYIVMVSAPITQTVYGFLVMLQIIDKLGAGVASGITLLGIGLATGIGEMISAWVQGIIGAGGCRMISEADGKGFALVVIAIGIAETVGIFVLVFMSILLGRIG
ncbi:MAG: V-type ATP synthase subunit K [Holophagae bacterium]|jgi:V/A-type H+-transporting ATPase subunit K|nr:MAG: V-type ATP synthase subunit K [Holophagae bacterium]